MTSATQKPNNSKTVAGVDVFASEAADEEGSLPLNEAATMMPKIVNKSEIA
jgi:hypothetical protein